MRGCVSRLLLVVLVLELRTRADSRALRVFVLSFLGFLIPAHGVTEWFQAGFCCIADPTGELLLGSPDARGRSVAVATILLCEWSRAGVNGGKLFCS